MAGNGDKEDVTVLKGSIASGVMNSLMTVAFSVTTFCLNAFILRHVNKDVLGTINVRLALLQSTVLFFSREWLRRACIKKPSNDQQWKSLINLIWLGLPLCIVLTCGLCHVWINVLDPPEDPSVAAQYPASVMLMGLSCLLELSGEVFWITCMMLLYVKFKLTLELLNTGLRAVFMAVVVTYAPHKAVVGSSLVTVFVTLLNFSLLNLYFYLQIRKSAREKAARAKKDDDADNHFPFKSLGDLYPDFTQPIHGDSLLLAVSFFKQGLLKQLLTEGEKYMFTWFSLMTLAEQGVYDVVSAFGAMAARLIFSKVEEAAYFYFSQTVTRGPIGSGTEERERAKITADRLRKLLRIVTLIGVIGLTYGQSYSHALLHLYGGTKLSDGIGPQLLRAQSIFTLFLAVNGVTECFAFATMTAAQLERYNVWMAFITLIFLTLSYALCKILGPVGLVLANCANFALRIAHSCLVISRRYRNLHRVENPLWGIVPNPGTVATAVLVGIVCKASESVVYAMAGYRGFACHVAVGAVCLALSLLQILMSERFLRDAAPSDIFVNVKRIGK